MKKAIFIILSIVLVISCLLSLTSCGDSKNSVESVPVALSIVMGAHKHFPKLSFTSENIQKAIYNACYNYGDISTFTVEGVPKLKGDYDISEPDKSITETKRKQLARQNANKIIYDCSLAVATTKEVDTLSAIKLSSNALQASSASRKEMLVYDSGLCTTGLISQASNDVLSVDTELIIEKLRNIHGLPNLEGITVKWFGLATVSGKQAEIPDSYKYKLEELWTAIIVASGGKVEFDKTPICGEEAEGLPDVSTVFFAQDSLNIDFSDVKAIKDGPLKIDESTIKFIADSEKFIEPEAAREVLTPVAKLLIDNPTLNIIVAGTTASAGKGYALSLKRAQACKDILVSMGANCQQIECIGLGSSNNCLHVDDLDSNGNLIEELAKRNRAIYIFAADSDLAKTIKST